MKNVKKRTNKKEASTTKVFVIAAAIIITFSVVFVMVFGAPKKIEADDNGVYRLSFSETTSNSALNALNGKQVSINGYISTLSPINGEFAYLMNLPYQNCPYCVPGTSELSNTLAIYAGNNGKINFTDELVNVVGTFETGKFTDEFGYTYGIRLNNVTVQKADVQQLSEEVKKYNALAENGIIGNIYNAIMIMDNTLYYDMYGLEMPSKIEPEMIISIKDELNNYNVDEEYNELMAVVDRMLELCNLVNGYIDSQEYTKVTEQQMELNNIYYSFSTWMSQGEL